MWDKLVTMEKRYDEVAALMSTTEVASDPDQLRKLGQERASIEDVVLKYRQYKETERTLEETKSMLHDSTDDEMKNLVKEELSHLEAEMEMRKQELRLSLLPRDPNDEKHVIVEIRSGTGGDEAGLFAVSWLKVEHDHARIHRWCHGDRPRRIGRRV